jgi:hypothetical protein
MGNKSQGVAASVSRPEAAMVTKMSRTESPLLKKINPWIRGPDLAELIMAVERRIPRFEFITFWFTRCYIKYVSNQTFAFR